MKLRGNWKVRQSAEMIEASLKRYSGDAEDNESNLQDALTDMIHYCYRHRLDFDTFLGRAKRHAEVERAPGFSEGKL